MQNFRDERIKVETRIVTIKKRWIFLVIGTWHIFSISYIFSYFSCHKHIGHYISDGSANGRDVFKGPLGGVYYKTKGRLRHYLNEDEILYNIDYLRLI